MNNFDDVFAIIKKHCDNEAGIAELDCFKAVENELEGKGIVNSLYLYLDVLQHLDLIKYHESAKVLCLTEKGKQAETVFES